MLCQLHLVTLTGTTAPSLCHYSSQTPPCRAASLSVERLRELIFSNILLSCMIALWISLSLVLQSNDIQNTDITNHVIDIYGRLTDFGNLLIGNHTKIKSSEVVKGLTVSLRIISSDLIRNLCACCANCRQLYFLFSSQPKQVGLMRNSNVSWTSK